jgi:hypothetical protein
MKLVYTIQRGLAFSIATLWVAGFGAAVASLLRVAA